MIWLKLRLIAVILASLSLNRPQLKYPQRANISFLSILHLPSLPQKCLPNVRIFCSRLLCYSLTFVDAAIREYDAKLLLAYWLERAPAVDPSATIKTKLVYPSPKVAQVSWDPATNAITPDTQLPGWVFNTKLVAKPDQLIKRRGKAGLLALNKTWDEAKEWIVQRAGKPQKVSPCPYSLFPLHLDLLGDLCNYL